MDENINEDQVQGQPTPNANETVVPLEEMTLAQLKEEAVKLGGTNLDSFKSREQMLTVIGMLQNKPAAVAPNAQFAPVVPGLDDANKDMKAWMGKRGIMMDKLWGQLESGQKTRVLLPLTGKEKPGIVRVLSKGNRKEFEPVSGAIWAKSFNGYTWMVPKGIYTDVPNQVADEIEREQVGTLSAGEQWDVNRIDPQTGRPVSERL